MTDKRIYSAQGVFEGLKATFHQYLEAQYHIWDESLILGRRQLLETRGVSFQEPQIEATPFYVPGKPYARLDIPKAAIEILGIASSEANTGIFPTPYAHQAEALEAFLGRDEEVIVATGTGSGKTESFLMPILGSLAAESAERAESWGKSGVRALLLYPMNALVNDQLGRLRRLFANQRVAAALKGRRSGRMTFGMYTSRTPYPGLSSPSKNKERIGKLLDQLYRGISSQARERLEREGKWPAKNLDQFLTSFVTGDEDSELITRHEMHLRSPDILVTNYSMLEYMLLRPLEKPIFDQTAQWLAADEKNKLTVVLDEAHMYRGAGGAEVAYLLRRLHSRLGVGRERVRYILTSASLGSTDGAQRQMKVFASKLTGNRSQEKAFTLILGKPEKKSGGRVATSKESAALAAFDLSLLHNAFNEVSPAEQALRRLGEATGHSLGGEKAETEAALRSVVYEWLKRFGPAALAANLITSRPNAITESPRLPRRVPCVSHAGMA
jgi:ATP-dependent helicase YprA (DUF1998 family)